jgi:hypothetical protein
MKILARMRPETWFRPTFEWKSQTSSHPRLFVFHCNLTVRTISWLIGWLSIWLYDDFSVTRLYSVDHRLRSEWWWIGKDLVGSGRVLILRYYPGIRMEWLMKTTKILNQDRRSLGPGYEPESSRIWSMSVYHSTTTFGFSVSMVSFIVVAWKLLAPVFNSIILRLKSFSFCFLTYRRSNTVLPQNCAVQPKWPLPSTLAALRAWILTNFIIRQV